MTKKLNNKKGFTLAELLVVVAIIAVLVAVSIPIFSAQTKKANLATNQANARAAKAAAVTQVLGGSTAKTFTYDIASGTIVADATTTDFGTLGEGKLDISAWNLTDESELGTKAYKTWVVTVTNETTNTGSNGTVTQYQYGPTK